MASLLAKFTAVDDKCEKELREIASISQPLFDAKSWRENALAMTPKFSDGVRDSHAWTGAGGLRGIELRRESIPGGEALAESAHFGAGSGAGPHLRARPMGGGHASAADPVFGFVLVGGALIGAQVRDVRLANELAARGFQVHVWWILERPHRSPLRAEVHQHWLCHSFRLSTLRFPTTLDFVGRLSGWPVSDTHRQRLVQTFPGLLDWSMRNLISRVCSGVQKDQSLIRHFSRELLRARVTHCFPNLAVLGPFIAEARKLISHPVQYLVTFQGYELYANYARELGCEAELYRRLYEAVEDSDWPAIAVSGPYLDRIHADIGLPKRWLRVIPPGVPIPEPFPAEKAHAVVGQHFAQYRPGIPLVTYLGRRDAEKGIDLLIYAAKLLHRRGCDFQLAICGPTAFGAKYSVACRQIAENLRLPVMWSDYVPDETRAALFAASHCVVYPPIHEEPFGMVPVEAMAYGTPCVVSDTGGVADVVRPGTQEGGVVFRSWDSGHLADRLEQILEDSELRSRLSASCRSIALHYSVGNLANRILDHMGLVNAPEFPKRSTEVLSRSRKSA